MAAGCGFDPGSQGNQMMIMMIRSYKEFDPSDKLSLGYFSITAANKKEIRISKKQAIKCYSMTSLFISLF